MEFKFYDEKKLLSIGINGNNSFSITSDYSTQRFVTDFNSSKWTKIKMILYSNLLNGTIFVQIFNSTILLAGQQNRRDSRIRIFKPKNGANIKNLVYSTSESKKINVIPASSRHIAGFEI